MNEFVVGVYVTINGRDFSDVLCQPFVGDMHGRLLETPNSHARVQCLEDGNIYNFPVDMIRYNKWLNKMAQAEMLEIAKWLEEFDSEWVGGVKKDA